MRIAIPVWNGRVSPVFDVARRVHVFDVARETSTIQTSRTVEVEKPATAIAALGIDVVICSAISLVQEAALRRSGVEVISGVCGPADAIAADFAAGDTDLARFRAPGCGD
jgi:predicted Fe-Mo cluster-binding NifX family protein